MSTSHKATGRDDHGRRPARSLADITTPLHADDPERVGPWELLARVGSGGMGTVYVARRQPDQPAHPHQPAHPDRPSPGAALAAVKVMHRPGDDGAGHRERFRREVRTLRQVQDFQRSGPPVTAELLGADTGTERPWLATAYLPALNLREAVAEHGPWPAGALRGLGRDLAVALRTVHDAGFAHRDIKPSNVLITETAPYLIDFGIACPSPPVDDAGGEGSADDPASAGATRTGQWAGSPGYLAPERAEARPATTAGDIFSWAAVLIFAATGRPPYGTGTAEELLFRARHTEPDLAGVPSDLHAVLRQALHPEPSARPTAAQLADDLARQGSVGGGAADRPPRSFAEELPPALRSSLRERAAVDFGEAVPRRGAPPGVGGEPEHGAPRSGRRPQRLAMGGAALLVGTTGAAGYAAGYLVRRGDTAPAVGGTATDPTADEPAGAPERNLVLEEPWAHRARLSTFSELALGNGVLLMKMRAAEELRALNAADGSGLWGQEGVSGDRPVITEDGTTAIMQGARDGDHDQLALLDVLSGEIAFSRHLGMTLSGMRTTPVIATQGTVAYLAGHDSETPLGYLETDQHPRSLVAYDLDTDEVLWQQSMEEVGGTWVVGALSGDHLVVLGRDVAIAYRREDGSEAWRRDLGAELVGDELLDLPPDRRIAADDSTVVITGRGTLSVDSRTGETNWSVEPDLDPGIEDLEGGAPDGALIGAPAMSDGLVYLTMARLTVMALDARTREAVWTWDSEDLLSGPPAGCTIAGGLVFPPTGFAAQTQIALDPATGEVAWERREEDHLADDSQVLGDEQGFYIRVGDMIRGIPR